MMMTISGCQDDDDDNYGGDCGDIGDDDIDQFLLERMG